MRISTTSTDPPIIDSQTPLYKSGILGHYIRYLETHHVEIETDALLQCCGLSRFDINDESRLLSQDQVDAFHHCLEAMLPDPELACKVGQYALNPQSTGTLKRYAFQFATTEAIYRAIDDLYPKCFRGHLSQTTIKGKGQAEITIRTRRGVRENPFQCKNRQGIFAAIAKIRTGRFAKVDHYTCMHRGDDACRYRVFWTERRSTIWKHWAIATAFICLGLSMVTAFFLPLTIWEGLSLLLAIFCFSAWMMASRLENQELTRFLKEQGDVTRHLWEAVDARNHRERLIQEVVQAGTHLPDEHVFLQTVLDAMAHNLDFRRGLLVLYTEDGLTLCHGAGYGFSTAEQAYLKQLRVDIGHDPANARFTQCIQTGQPIFFEDVDTVAANLHPDVLALARRLKVESLICIPVLHQQASLGILFVDTQAPSGTYTANDVNLLMGISARIAASIISARLFAQIQASEKRYRLMAENVMDVIWMFTVETLEITYASPSVEKVFGYPPAEVMGLSMECCLTPTSHQNTVATLSDALARVSTGVFDTQRDAVTVELEAVHKNGTIIPIEVTARLLLGEDGIPATVLGISRDLSLRKRDERERHEIERQCQQSKKMESLGTMAGSIAHNFNNLLMVVLGNLELAKEELGDSSAVLNIQRAIHAAQRAADLSGMMLTYVGQLKKESVPVDLSQMVTLVLKNMDESTMSNVDLDLELADPMPLIAADAGHMRQMIAGFVTNAFEAIGRQPGRVRVSTGAMHCDARFLAGSYLKEDHREGLYAYVEVADTGCGMDAETLNKVFDPFFSTKFTGRGLGMAAVLGIIRSHDGIVRVESKKDRGAVFTALFPIQGVSHHRSPPEMSPTHTPSAGKTILLVDDEALVMDIGRQFLKRMGFTVKTAASGIEALAILSADEPIDCLLLDFSMPGMNGLETLAKAKELRPHVKIVITSGYTRQQIEDRFLSANGPDDFIQKPFEIKVLQDKLGRLLSSPAKGEGNDRGERRLA